MKIATGAVGPGPTKHASPARSQQRFVIELHTFRNIYERQNHTVSVYCNRWDGMPDRVSNTYQRRKSMGGGGTAITRALRGMRF